MKAKRYLIPLILTSGLIAGADAAQNAAGPDEQKAARAEIETLTKRIEELSKKLGPDSGVRVTVIERGADGKTVERRMIRTGPDGKTMGPREPGDMRKRIEMRRAGMTQVGIGVVLAPDTDGKGAKLAAVSPNGPAKNAGLQTGDVITAVNGKAVSDVAQTRAALSGLKEGQAVSIGYSRAGKAATANLKAASIVPQMVINRERRGMDNDGRGKHGFAFATRWHGLNMAELNPQLGRYFGASAGVLVLSPKADFPQLQAGDVIVKVDGKAVSSARDVLQAMRGKAEGSQVTLDILRDRKTQRVIVSVPKVRTFNRPMQPPRAAMLEPEAPHFL